MADGLPRRPLRHRHRPAGRLVRAAQDGAALVELTDAGRQSAGPRSSIEPATEPSAAAITVLREVFGLPDFRPGQGEVVAAAESGADVLFVAPTGSGKSIAYWVPGIVAGDLTIVVSPLIALMVDQVARLTQLGIPSACVHSQMTAEERREAMIRASAGELRFLYLAPERIGAGGFLDALGRLRVSRLVVDEAHCISSWGHDFRPEYRRLGDAIAACGRPPVGAFTATATPRVRLDIIASLGLRNPGLLRRPQDRDRTLGSHLELGHRDRPIPRRARWR
ncbi:MAG: DEAD/DEAH box helicase [Chloroflexota bacterium]|nr:MAG: DEAD/DEAH box helicase [Chloroflexota bacterium]